MKKEFYTFIDNGKNTGNNVSEKKSEKNTKEKNIPSDNDKKPFRFFIIGFTVFLLCMLLFFNQDINRSFQKKVDYNTFLTQLEAGLVESAEPSIEESKVTYKLKDDMMYYYTNHPKTENFTERLLLAGVELKTTEKPLIMYILSYGSLPLMVLFFFFFYRSMLADANSSKKNNPSTQKSTTKFSDIAGMDEVKEDMLLIADMMKNPEYRKSGARIPRGILLQGPPGNGKTLLARAFAGELGVNFIAVNACDFGSQFVSMGSTKIKKVFEQARKSAPCVIFIDEIDSVGSKRMSADSAAGKEMNTMLTTLLNQMDGFTPLDDVMVLAATNRASDLDEALIRPGRFDRQIVVNPPDKNTRIEVFKLYTKGKKLNSDVDFERLANKTFGYSCSKIESITNEAIINSIKNKHTEITMQDFEDAILHMDIKGHVKKKFHQTENERETVAYHEAGHAVVAKFATNNKVSTVTIRPTTSGAGGFTITEKDHESSLCPISDYRKQLLLLYGGRAAEVKLRGTIDEATAGASADIEHATKIATSYVCIEQGIDYSAFGKEGISEIMSLTKTLLKKSWEETCNIINDKWIYVDAVAKELIKCETISSERFEEIVNEITNSHTSNGDIE